MTREILSGTNVLLLIVILVIAGVLVLESASMTKSDVATAVNGSSATLSVTGDRILLPAPDHTSDKTLDYALEHRRSVRGYSNTSLSPESVSLILWSAQGITNPATGKRTAPSAMATYPLTLFVLVSNVTGVAPGIYTYDPVNNTLDLYQNQSGKDAALSVLGQKSVFSAPVTIVISADYAPFQKIMKSDEEITRHVSLEAGHAVQNVLLMETSRGLAGVPFTGFNATAAEDELGLGAAEHVIYAVTAGYLSE